METAPRPELVWIDTFTERCPLTGGPLVEREGELFIDGLNILVKHQVMGWSERAGCHFGLLGALAELASRAGRSPYEAEAFEIDGEPVAAALYLTGAEMLVPWSVFVAEMAEAKAHAERPPLTPQEVRQSPRLSETWELAACEGEPTADGGTLLPTHIVVVTDAGGQIRSAAVRTGALTAADLAEVVFDATTARPEKGLTAGRPARLAWADPAVAARLRRRLKTVGIGLHVGPTAQAESAARDIANSVARGGGRVDVSLLADVSDDDLAAFVGVARGFYAAAPWTRLRGDRYLAFRLDDGPWLYANVMGQAGEEQGIALFDDWLGLCRFVSAAPAPGESATDALEETGAAEGLTLYPLGMLHETDAERLKAAGPPAHDGMYAVASRFTAQDGFGASAWPPDVYTALMRALPGVIAGRRAATITSIKANVETPEGLLTLRYPADGTEALTGREPAVELVVEPVRRGDDSMSMTPLDTQGLRVVGPAATRLPKADRAVREALRWGFVRMVEMDGRPVWFGDSYADDPAPTLDDLAGARSLRVMFGAEMHPATARRLAEPVDEVRAERADA